MRTIDKIIIHCTASPQGRQLTVKDIDRMHRKQNFRCIGYHFVVYLDGSIHFGRPIEQIGAHCRGHNNHSVGVCYVGGLDGDGKTPKDTRTPQQKAALAKLVADLVARFPNATVHGHNEFANKACPCFNVKDEF